VNDALKLKETLIANIQNILDQSINNSKIAIKSAIDSKNTETKSSAGDKFETGRAMMQMEQEKNEVQLLRTLKLKKIASQINLNILSKKAQLGSLVLTDNGKYFISVGLGKIQIEKLIFYVISLDSPIAQILVGKGEGDKVVFQQKEIVILNIY